RQIEAGFRAIGLRLGSEIKPYLSLECENGVPLAIAGRIQIVDPRSGDVMAEGPATIDARFPRQSYGLGMMDEAAQIQRRLHQDGLDQVQLRILPDRNVAVADPTLETYFGLVIERTVPVVQP
ncbi:MAG TPA: hypothetical protein VGM03_22835, partial [Phycisphaerae bacterium]